MIKRCILIGMCLSLMGCGSLKKQWTEFAPDRDTVYLDAYAAPTLSMPEGLAMNKAYLSDPYPLPKGPLPGPEAEPVDIYPPTLKEKSDVDTTHTH